MAAETIFSLAGVCEPASSFLHFAGAIVFALLSKDLLEQGRNNAFKTTSLAVFAVAAVLLLGISAVYHIFSPGQFMRGFMLRIDSAAIFVLIAATNTPIHVILFRGLARWGFLLILWSLTAAAMVLKTVYFGDISAWFSLALYVGLGWMGACSAVALTRRFNFSYVVPVVLGGLAYTIGGVVNLFDGATLIPGVIGPHELLHVAVLTGLGCHWRFVHGIAREDLERMSAEEEPRVLLCPAFTRASQNTPYESSTI